MTKTLAKLSLILILVSVACSMPVFANSNASQLPQIVSQLMITADPRGTATPTPFQPLRPTATPEATNTSTPVPQDTLEPGLDVPGQPTPVRLSGVMPKGQVNLLVLGSDFRPGSGFRTDVMMLVSINTIKGTVSVVSIPRDLYVTIPGWTTQRINTAFPHGGFPMMADTINYNFGIVPSYYIMTNFQGFSGIVDSLGGINVNTGSYLSDTCDLPQAVGGYCSVGPGTVYMDGGMALWYVRSRYTSSDFDRGRRGREVLYAIFQRLMSLDAINRLPELYAAYQSSVETNMNLGDIAQLLSIAPQILADSSLIHQYSIGPAQVTPYTTAEGAMVLLPNYEAILQVFQQAIFGE